MKHASYFEDDISYEIIPRHIMEAAIKIEKWMAKDGYGHWQLLGLCSRNYAYELEGLQRKLDEFQKILDK